MFFAEARLGYSLHGKSLATTEVSLIFSKFLSLFFSFCLFLFKIDIDNPVRVTAADGRLRWEWWYHMKKIVTPKNHDRSHDIIEIHSISLIFLANFPAFGCVKTLRIRILSLCVFKIWNWGWQCPFSFCKLWLFSLSNKIENAVFVEGTPSPEETYP